jgi:hypothetical protein
MNWLAALCLIGLVQLLGALFFAASDAVKVKETHHEHAQPQIRLVRNAP